MQSTIVGLDGDYQQMCAAVAKLHKLSADEG